MTSSPLVLASREPEPFSAPRQSVYSRRVKPLLDWILAALTLTLTWPLLLLLALLVRLDSTGPALYKQERVGLDRRRRQIPPHRGWERRKQTGYGRPFTIFKFRSMVVDAEQRTGPVWAMRRDPRVTRMGAWLRATHLDELPQLINVLKGEMSFVGPRPERPELVARLVRELPEYPLRSRVLPGITGIAQIRNGYDSSLESVARKVTYDLSYIRHINPWLDFQLIGLTALVPLRGSDGTHSHDADAERGGRIASHDDVVPVRLHVVPRDHRDRN